MEQFLQEFGSQLPNIQVIRYIGSGGYGNVYEGMLIDIPVAIKVMALETSRQQKLAKNEIEVLKYLSEQGCEEYILCYRGYKIHNNKIALVTDYVPGEDLLDYLMEHGSLDEETAIYLFRRIAEANLKINEKGIIHHDLKLDNIRVDSDLNPVLLDFGFACQVGFTHPQILHCQDIPGGTPATAAPERFMQDSYDLYQSDVYSLGCIFYACLMEFYPYGNEGFSYGYPVEPIPSQYSLELRKLIYTMLAFEPEKRPTSRQVYEKLHG